MSKSFVPCAQSYGFYVQWVVEQNPPHAKTLLIPFLQTVNTLAIRFFKGIKAILQGRNNTTKSSRSVEHMK